MGQKSFIVRTEEGRVYVKHQVPPVLATIVGLAITVIGLLIIPGCLSMLSEARQYRDIPEGLKACLGLCVPVFGLLFWRVLARAREVMECDAKELHHARLRTWAPWMRRKFAVAEVKGLHTEVRSGSRSRYRLISFRYGRERVEMLLGISAEDAASVLSKCKALGVDVAEDVEVNGLAPR